MSCQDTPRFELSEMWRFYFSLLMGCIYQLLWFNLLPLEIFFPFYGLKFTYDMGCILVFVFAVIPQLLILPLASLILALIASGKAVALGAATGAAGYQVSWITLNTTARDVEDEVVTLTTSVEEQIKYVDVTLFYPWVNKNGGSPLTV